MRLGLFDFDVDDGVVDAAAGAAPGGEAAASEASPAEASWAPSRDDWTALSQTVASVARFNEEACRPPMDLTPEQLFLATFIHETRDVRSGISKFAAETGVSQEEALTTCVPLVESALSGGLLEIRDKA